MFLCFFPIFPIFWLQFILAQLYLHLTGDSNKIKTPGEDFESMPPSSTVGPIPTGNFRTKLCRAGFHEVAVNSGKRSRNNPDKQAPHTNIKRPNRAEVNFLPNFPRGEDAASPERLRLQIVDEVKMTDKTLPLIGKLMQTTFALWRKEVISDEPPVGEILERWPALKLESQVKCFSYYTYLSRCIKCSSFVWLCWSELGQFYCGHSIMSMFCCLKALVWQFSLLSIFSF